jgi:hypothetical protein
MRLKILACIVLFAASMEAVRIGAHQFVAAFGTIAAFALIATAYFTARYFERRR